MFARKKKKTTLSPAFVIVATAASALVACSDVGDFFSGGGGEPTSNPPPPDCGSGCMNPPPPPPVVPPRPDFGATREYANAAPLGAASMIITADESQAIVTDPDRDRAVVVDLKASPRAVHAVAFDQGAEPARLVEDAAHKTAHVVLRRSGTVATIDLATSKIVANRAVSCASPQGIAIDAALSKLYVTCSGGELVSLPSDAQQLVAATTIATLDRDLRDVVLTKSGTLLISRLRSAEILVVKKDGTVADRGLPPSAFTGASGAGGAPGSSVTPFSAWRLAAASNGENAFLVHQLSSNQVLNVEAPQAYGGQSPCSASIQTTVSAVMPPVANEDPAKPFVIATGPLIGDGVATVDIAASPDGQSIALIAAGNGHTRELPQVHVLPSTVLPSSREGAKPVDPMPTCATQPQSQNNGRGGSAAKTKSSDPPGQAVALAFTASSKLVVFTREPAAIHINTQAALVAGTYTWDSIDLGGQSVEDTGQAVFHSNAGGGIACVSCHPEAGDDGRVWNFSTGARRTQSLLGTVKGTAPYHWGGDAPDMDTFATVVFAQRMGGQALVPEQVTRLQTWLENTKPEPVSIPKDSAAVTRGKDLFENATVGCASCHSGSKLTNNESFDVGTVYGTPTQNDPTTKFQTPPLTSVSTHAPFLHNGCAKTLADTFSSTSTCLVGHKHGNASALTAAEQKDLVTYLESL